MSTNEIIAYVVVFIVSAVPFFEAFTAVPLGVLGGMNVVMTTIVGLASNILALVVVILAMARIKEWYLKRRERRGKGKSRRSARAEHIYNKYGLIGLAFIGPFFIGTMFTALIAVILGGKKSLTLLWLILSCAFWTVLVSVLIYYGVDFLGLEQFQFLQDILE